MVKHDLLCFVYSVFTVDHNFFRLSLYRSRSLLLPILLSHNVIYRPPPFSLCLSFSRPPLLLQPSLSLCLSLPPSRSFYVCPLQPIIYFIFFVISFAHSLSQNLSTNFVRCPLLYLHYISHSLCNICLTPSTI